jgi:hypothetical protein
MDPTRSHKTRFPRKKAGPLIKHKDCAKKDINNVQSVMDNNGNDPEWMNSPSSGGYDYDSLIYELKVYEK